ncbi:MAG TPA: glycosyl hydrolase family 18 protein [Patescibacteria group bacterium]|nr:glycosyl hydrolase family 18 protein [Patescibacteria group bacterium]
MRKIIAVILLIGAAILYVVLFLHPTPVSKKTTTLSPATTQQPAPSTAIVETTLFVPYWSEDTINSGYSTYVYFGITPTVDGISTKDDGYGGIPSFVAATQGSTTLLTVRMLPGDTTENILQNNASQDAVIQDSIDIAKQNGFDGIVLDLEYSGLAFPSVTQSITDFSKTFADKVKTAHLSFYQTLFGDTFYLARPYNVTAIAKNADGIFVLAYDFHKANGTPGTNFPFESYADADYNFVQMVKDFGKQVAKEKLTIIFGMFGYDWTIDQQGRPIHAAESLTTNEMLSKFSSCHLKDCKVVTHPEGEIEATYTDSANQGHDVWFENLTSVEYKKQFLQKNGISKIGFWANGYF